MNAKLTSLQRDELKVREKRTAAGCVVWTKRRTWSRTDTARWLSDRSETVLALLRRRPGQWPKHTRQIGYWLKNNATNFFERAHDALAAVETDTERERLLASDVLQQ